MRRRTVLAGLGLLGAVSPVLAAQTRGELQPVRAPAQLYAVTCGYCHGRNVGPVLLGRKYDPALIEQMVRLGPNGMPAFRQTEITPSELKALAHWIAQSKPNTAEGGR
jgi:mono/diheme cytochrome c family protein